MFPLAAIPVIGELFKGLFGVIDEVHTSVEEKLTLQQQLFGLQVALVEKIMDYEARLVEAQAKIITAEAMSDSWIASNWRPITMLTFVVLIVNRWTGLFAVFGLPKIDIPLEIENQLWLVVQLGLGGYVAGRSLEKIVPAIAQVLTNGKKEQGANA